MDYLLFIIILAVVVVMGYILSRPFTKPTNILETPEPMDDHEDQYYALLKEIKAIERDLEAGATDKHACIIQIALKKQRAADLLRLINPLQALETASNPEANPPDNGNPNSGNNPLQETDFCPQCGDHVLVRDKFCMHCGHRLGV